MWKPILLLVASLVVAACLGWTLFSTTNVVSPPGETAATSPPESKEPLVVYCAASNRSVMQAIAKDYEREYGVPVDFQFGPSQTLLSSIEVTRTGDLYLPADSSYLEIALERGLITEVIPLARMHVVVGVGKDNPLGLSTFDDLLKENCRLVQANPDVAAVGKLTREELTRQHKWEEFKNHTTAFVGSVTEAANSVKAGAADAGIVYDAVLTTYPELSQVEIEEFKDLFAEVKIALIKGGTQSERALHFARYAGAGDRGLKEYAAFGFTPVSGEPWSGAKLP